MRTKPAKVTLLPLRVTGMSARLADGRNIAVPGARIDFKDLTGQVLCSATTDWDGNATCNSGSLLGSVEALLSGYTAVFTSPVENLDSKQAHGTATL